ncbi:hypothetical protein CYMTET_48284 [Cymbomonas tetramitiformis]|uniref:Ubiquitin thioesterase OTU n=1 Tax=Cymbomonas tetramitiformis TaxID=36881 RepID=A0AAE0BSL0_9CHLO|nr:hypothetical protein CYMTET_48284 [Cymbomonas tetramitiformis]
MSSEGSDLDSLSTRRLRRETRFQINCSGRQEMSSARQGWKKLRALTRTELEELRHFRQPPPSVRLCLELIYITLHVERLRPRIEALGVGARLRIDWEDVQQMLARFQTFFPALMNFDTDSLVTAPVVHAYITRVYFEGAEALTVEKVQRSSHVCAVLFRWCLSSLQKVKEAVEDTIEQGGSSGSTHDEEAQRRAAEEARVLREAEAEAKKLEEERRSRAESELQAKHDADRLAKKGAEEKAKQEAERKAKRDAQEQARRQAEEMARREAEAKARREEEEKAKSDGESEEQVVTVPPPGTPPRKKIPTTGALQALPPKLEPGDGSCLFHSLSYGLKGTTATILRKEVADYVESHPEMAIAGTPIKDWVLWDSGLDVRAYAARMGTGNHWGGAIEIAVCGLVKGVSVHVYEKAQAGTFTRISSFDHGGKSQRNINVVYGGRVHYDALEAPR